MYTIYALVDPSDGLIRYVGQAQDIYARFIQHINCESRNAEKNLWVMSCRSRNLMIQMRTLETVEAKEQALEAEKKWIEHYCALNMPLLNKFIAQEWFRQQEALRRQLEQTRADLETACQQLESRRESLKNEIAQLHESGHQEAIVLNGNGTIPTLQEVVVAFSDKKPSKRNIQRRFGITDYQAYNLYKQLEK